MALINCYNCGSTVSDRARICPKCGAPLGLTYNNNQTGNTNGKRTSDDQTIMMEQAYGADGNTRYSSQNAASNYVPNAYPPKKSNKGIIIGLCAAVFLLLAGLVFILIKNNQDEREAERKMAEMTEQQKQLEKANNKLEAERARLAEEEAAERERQEDAKRQKAAKEQRKRNAYHAFKKLITDSQSSYDYTDDLGLKCWRVGQQYYLRDITNDGIPEVWIKYDKYYEDSDIESETLLDCYRYSARKGKVECVYNRLNMNTPMYKGNTVYTYGNGCYDKLRYVSSSDRFELKKYDDSSYPSDDVAIQEYSIYNLDPLKMFLNQ